MKLISLITVLIICWSSSTAQVTFGELKTIEKSLQDNTPFMFPYKDGYKLFSLDKNSLNFHDLDLNLNVIKSGEVAIPEVLEKPDIEMMHNGKLRIMKIDDNLILNVHEFDLEKNEFLEIAALNLGEKDDLESEKTFHWTCKVRPDGSFLLIGGLRADQGRFIGVDGGMNNVTDEWGITVFSLSPELDEIYWKYIVKSPEFPKANQSTRILSVESIGKNEFVVSWVGGVKGHLKKNSFYKNFYQHTGSELKLRWTHESPWTISNEMLEGEPLPYLTNSGEFEYLLPVFRDFEQNNISVEVRDINNDLVVTYETDLVLPELKSKSFIDFTTTLLDDGDTERVILTIEDGRKMKGKHPKYLVNLEINKYKLNSQYLISGENIQTIRMPYARKVIDGNVLFYTGSMYLKDDQVQFIDLKNVFPKMNASGYVYQLFAGDKCFMLYTEYSTIRMKTDIVECIF